MPLISSIFGFSNFISLSLFFFFCYFVIYYYYYLVYAMVKGIVDVV